MASFAGIAARAVGQYPLSIATSLAIESTNGVHPDIVVEKPPILEYPEIWINIRTLFRNLMGSFDKDTAGGVVPPELMSTLVEEMDTIASIIRDSANGRTNVIFYYSNYKDIDKKYHHAVFIEDRTDRQKQYTLIHNQTMKLLLKQHANDIRIFDLKLHSEYLAKALILTHYPYDLLSHKSFGQLDLLESHTGAIKGRALYYTKYHEGKTLSRIPFREDLIQVFGDSVIFKPYDIKVRKEVIEIAEKYKWNQVVTFEKLKYGIEQIKNPYAKEVLLSIISARY
jgi:hypothetical protein